MKQSKEQKQPKLSNREFICTLTVIFPGYFLITRYTDNNHSTPLNICFNTISQSFSILLFLLLLFFPMPAITDMKIGLLCNECHILS